jgi:hypothetical protein
MWALTRFPEFYRAYRAADVTWSPDDLPPSLHLADGIFVSFLLVTPFWTVVGFCLHSLIK